MLIGTTVVLAALNDLAEIKITYSDFAPYSLKCRHALCLPLDAISNICTSQINNLY